MSSTTGGISGLSGGLSGGASAASVWNNPQILGALLPGYNISALDQAMQAQLTADAIPLDQLSSQLSTLQTQAAAWQQIQTDLGNLQTDAQTLAATTPYNTLAAATSAPTEVTATVAPGTSGVAGTYQIAVSQLAQTEIDNSATQTSNTAALGKSGSFTINGKSVTVGSTDSLQTVAQSINAANAGTTATVLPTIGGYVLNIASTDGNAITWTDPNNILSGLGVLSGGAPAHQLQPAKMAQYTVNGVAEQSATNTDSTTIPGVTLNLLATTPTSPSTPAVVTLTQNQQAVVGAVQQMATDFNTLLGDLNKLGGKGGTLEGQASLLSISQTLQQTLTGTDAAQPSGYQSLAQIGVTLSAPVSSPSNLSMSVDTTTLQNALQSDPGAVQSLLNGVGGIATQLQQQLNAFVGPTGSIPSQLTSLQNQISSIGTEINDPNSPVNQEITMQQQALQTQFQNMLTALMSSQAQGQQIQGFIQAQSGSSSNSSQSGGTGSGG